jgi:hypothetical protein
LLNDLNKPSITITLPCPLTVYSALLTMTYLFPEKGSFHNIKSHINAWQKASYNIESISRKILTKACINQNR